MRWCRREGPRELTAEGVPDLSRRLREIYNPIVLAIRHSDKPFVAAVQGASAGLGVSLALACDLLLAAESSYLLLAFVGIAVMPDGGSTAFLSERLGLTRSEELCMLGRRLPADKAKAWGLVNAVHPPGQLQSAALGLARRLAAEDPRRMAYVKSMLSASVQHDLSRHLELEADLQQRHGATDDYEEGRAAFADKRRPHFSGT
ncbi:enoyl-CoA hydratase-related protein [Nocardioides humi]|uniref:enoyl-CoA hydratase-related protein n=1 Tax=Nocardioides humi TaxID=449461 RepID=UPI00319DEFF6